MSWGQGINNHDIYNVEPDWFVPRTLKIDIRYSCVFIKLSSGDAQMLQRTYSSLS